MIRKIFVVLFCLLGGIACGSSGGAPTTPTPTVKADFSLYTGNGLMVTMTDRSINATSKSINWGDGKIGSDLVHIYEGPGEYTVSLTVTGSSNATDSKSEKTNVAFAEFNLGRLATTNTSTDPNMPLPSNPTAACTLAPAPVAGKVRYKAQMSPGTVQVQVYLIRWEDVQTGNIGCGSNRPSTTCPRGIGPQIIDSSQDVFWDVLPDRYCLALRYISTPANGQRVEGPVDLIAPFIP